MQLAEIGYFSKTKGLKGYLVLFQKNSFDMESCNAIFVESGGSKVPYLIQENQPVKNGFILKLEDVNNINEAASFVGKKAWIEEKYLIYEEQDEFLGYTVMDSVKGNLGAVQRVVKNPGNEFMEIIFQTKTILLPLHPDFIVKTDHKQRIIYYKAPEGLVDLYL